MREEELLELRKTIIVAIASDELLMERLVLKGGNALDIVYRIGERSSLDVDFSMTGDFKNPEELARISMRMESALRDRFDSIGYVVFDFKLLPRPSDRGGPGLTMWGGYSVTFKLLTRERFRELGGVIGAPTEDKVLDSMRRESQVSGPGSNRTFSIEISKFEYCEGKIVRDVGGYDCYVYSPAMLAAEKLRALCQQLPEYPLRRHPTPRPRDFFDIYTIATRASCDLSDSMHHDLVRQMFAVKEVPLSLLELLCLPETKAFHEQQWSAVQNAVRGGPEHNFDFYFDFVCRESNQLLNALQQSPAS